MKTFTCDRCGETYESNRSDEDCWKEFNEISPEAIHDPIAILCDDCFEEFMAWFKTLSSEQKRKMREDYMKEISV